MLASHESRARLYGGSMSPLLAPAAPAEAEAAEAQTQPRVPFIRAAFRHTELAFDTTFTPGASASPLGPFDVPAYGFVRAVWLFITGTGGNLGAGAIAADAPFNVLNSVGLSDTAGAPIVFPLSGYQLYLANLFGAYRGYHDPTAEPEYDGSINMNYAVRIPVEITPWDGFGSLANQSAQNPFRVNLTGAALADLVVGGAPVAPTVRIRAYVEAYSVPAPTDLLGQSQEQAPPGHGAVQYWSVAAPTVSAAFGSVNMPRVGNLMRNLILVHRLASGARDEAMIPDAVTLRWDSRDLVTSKLREHVKRDMYHATGLSTLPAGVLAFMFTDDQDGSAGFENRHQWLPTVQSTRLDYEGTFDAAGTLEIVTNDIAVTAAGR